MMCGFIEAGIFRDLMLVSKGVWDLAAPAYSRPEACVTIDYQ